MSQIFPLPDVGEGLTRSSVVIALGGGVTGDIAGFVTFYTVVIGNFFVPAAADLEADYSSMTRQAR